MSGELTTPSGRKLPEEIGGYRVIARLSRGGMGEVLLGQKESHGFLKKVAIKVVLPHVAEDEEFRTLFFDEARLMARMSHSHITQVFDFGIDEGHLFMVMELVDGLSVERLFAEHQKRGTRMPPELAGLAIAQAARGLHSAHVLTDEQGNALNVVHRDVSPQNLIITWSGSAKVLDFGIARSSVRRGQTQIGVVRGKPGYMAPEQARNQPLDARTDIFQLGIVLFELLAGRELYVRDNMYEAIAAAVDEPVPDVTAEVPGIDPGYGDVLSAALAKSPEERFRTADAMARALDAVIARAGYPVSEASLSDHLKSLRPAPSSSASNTAAVLTPGQPTATGRATGMSTVEIDEPGAAPVPAADAGRPPARETQPVATDSTPPRPAVETGQPQVKTFPARETLTTPTLAPETGTAVVEQDRRRRLVAAAVIALLVVLGIGGAVVLGGEGAPPAVVTPAPPPAVVDAGQLAAADAVAPPQATADAGAEEAAVTVASAPASEEARPRRRRRRRPVKAPRDDKPAVDDKPQEAAPAPKAAPAPVPPTTTPRKAETGTLFVVSEPYAHIFVDGQRMGDTPKMLKLAAGTHALKLVDPQSGAAWLSRSIDVKTGRNPPLKAKQP